MVAWARDVAEGFQRSNSVEYNVGSARGLDVKAILYLGKLLNSSE